MRIPRFAPFLAVTLLFVPVLNFAQSQAVRNENSSALGTPELTDPGRPATPVNDSVVAVRDLRMSGKGQAAFKRGTDLLLKGDARGSVVYFEDTISLDPGYYRAYHNLGLAECQLGEKAVAEEAFQRAIELTNGGFAPSQFALGMMLFEKGQLRQAEELIQHGLTMAPDSSIGKYFLAVVQFALNRLPDAERSAHDALLLSAKQAEAHILLAAIHERSHNPYAVEADVAAYLKLDPHGPLEREANVLLLRAKKEISQKPEAFR